MLIYILLEIEKNLFTHLNCFFQDEFLKRTYESLTFFKHHIIFVVIRAKLEMVLVLTTHVLKGLKEVHIPAFRNSELNYNKKNTI